MEVISSWRPGDRPQSRVGVVLELGTVWAVHVVRSYRLLRGTAH